jgi:L-alanine-DL-glutamate epimerase-like enolase superfamily enzyme
MRIANLKAAVHSVPLRIPLIDEPVQNRRLVSLHLETEEGITGFGMTGHYQSSGAVAVLHDEILPVVRGMDLRDVEAVHDRIFKKVNRRAMTGVVSSALSALDIAMWDAHGKAVGRTVTQLLGGFRDYAPSYITFGFPEYDRDQLVQAARDTVAQGHHRLKMVVAEDKGGWREDARRVRAVRDAVGEDVELAMDANNMFSPVEALLLARAVQDQSVTWFEEPVPVNDARAMADLRNRTDIPLSAGQNEGHRWRMRELVHHHAVDILQPNVVYCGGYTEGRRIAHLAQAYNLPIANGAGWPRFNMHLQAAMANGWRVEFHLGMSYIEDLMFVDPPQPKDDIVRIPTAPGLGLEVRWDFLEEMRVR